MICTQHNLTTILYIILICLPYELLQCNNVLCNAKEHVSGICQLYDDIKSAYLESSEINPVTVNLKSINIVAGKKSYHDWLIALF